MHECGEGLYFCGAGESLAVAERDAARRGSFVERTDFHEGCEAARDLAGEQGQEGVALSGGDEVLEGFETGGEKARGCAAALAAERKGLIPEAVPFFEKDHVSGGHVGGGEGIEVEDGAAAGGDEAEGFVEERNRGE